MYSKCPDTVILVEMDPKVARTGQFDLNLDLQVPNEVHNLPVGYVRGPRLSQIPQ